MSVSGSVTGVCLAVFACVRSLLLSLPQIVSFRIGLLQNMMQTQRNTSCLSLFVDESLCVNGVALIAYSIFLCLSLTC